MQSWINSVFPLFPESPSVTRKKEANTNAAADAEKIAIIAENSGNRVYTLQRSANGPDDPKRPLRFLTFGCQGSGDEDQLSVARLINELCADPATKPDFIIVTGDNVYACGAVAANDPQIEECVDNKYARADLPKIKHVPFFFLLGNHDLNLKGMAENIANIDMSEVGIARGMHEIAHNYLADFDYTAQRKQELYAQSTLFLDKLPLYNMPHRYYSLIAGDTEIFCMDSSTYVDDYLALLAHPAQMNEHNNQAAWLAAEVARAKAAGRKIILADHHPPHSPTDHHYKSDLDIYSKIANVAAKLGLHIPKGKPSPYIMFYRRALELQGLVFDVTMTAHDHAIYYRNNINDPNEPHKSCQLTVGGGGGPRQRHVHFSDQHNMGCYRKKLGVALVNHVPGTDDFDFTIHTVDHEPQPKFNNHSREAIIHIDENNPEKQAIIKILKVVQTALEGYYQFLGEKQDATDGAFLNPKITHLLSTNITHGNKGVEDADDMWAYIKRPHPASYPEIVDNVYRLSRIAGRWTTPSENSLITYLEDEIAANYQCQDHVTGRIRGKTFTELHAQRLTDRFEKGFNDEQSNAR